MVKIRIKSTQEITEFGAVIKVNNVMTQITEGLVHMNPSLFEVIYEKEILIKGEDGPIYKGDDYFVVYTGHFVTNGLRNGELYMTHRVRADEIKNHLVPDEKYIKRFREYENARCWLRLNKLLPLRFFIDTIDCDDFYNAIKNSKPEVYWLKIYSFTCAFKKEHKLNISIEQLFRDNQYVNHLL